MLTVGDGSTLKLNVAGVPGQEAAVGVTVIRPEILVVPALVAVNDILPLPLAGRPIAVLLLVHV